jgi:hypothetical protein
VPRPRPATEVHLDSSYCQQEEQRRDQDQPPEIFLTASRKGLLTAPRDKGMTDGHRALALIGKYVALEEEQERREAARSGSQALWNYLIKRISFIFR